MGIISRIPIFIKSPDTASGDIYWGQASTVIMEDALISESGLTDDYPYLKFAIRGENGTGKNGEIFRGDKDVFESDPVTLDVSFPNGSWQLAAVPLKGWGRRDLYSYILLTAGAFISLVIGLLLWSLIRTRYALKDLAFHDALTGLPNRMLFADRFSLAVINTKRTGKLIAVMMLDLNKFKEVNDDLGHATGDILLKEVAGRLTMILRKSDTVVRYGGDEFIIMLQDIAEPYVLAEIESKIIKVFSEPFICNGKPVTIGTSIGTAIYPVDGMDMESLLKKADKLMYASKKSRR
jgi:diguanylate cyclase (GGDEF)-like protein